jgi:ATP-dependent RNA helicase DeaD
LDKSEIFDTQTTFADLGLNDSILADLDRLGFKHPTFIQSKLIPIALSGKDCLGQAKTGTGKTASFALPALQMLKPGDAFAALILVPTRELAIQVAKEFHELGGRTGLKAVPIYGGQPIRQQIPLLEGNPEIIVGTPGRIMDMRERRLITYDHVRYAVLDEVDRMLDIGFREDIRKILGGMRNHPQTVFVSATISDEIEKLARSYMRNPEKIVTVAKSLTVQQVAQSYLSVEPWDKRRLLLHLLRREEPGLTVVFCRTKKAVDDVTLYLNDKGIDAHAMHGDMYQRKRDKVMDRLRDGKLSVLVASDLAARGLDVDDITHVVNYDVPEDPEVYIHRIGRTARAGRNGVAWMFVCPDQGDLLTGVERLANIEIPRLEYSDFTPGPIPQAVVARRAEEAQRKAASAESKSRDILATTKVDPADEAKFPGGAVPMLPPPKRLGGRLATRRR